MNNNNSFHSETIRAGLSRRHLYDKLFQLAGALSVLLGLLFLGLLFTALISKGYSAFVQTYVNLEVVLEETEFTGETQQQALRNADYRGMINASLRTLFPGPHSRRDRKALYNLLSNGAEYDLRNKIAIDPGLIGTTLSFAALADDETDLFIKAGADPNTAANQRLTPAQLEWIRELIAQGLVEQRFNRNFFTRGDSREPEQAGIFGALIGSFYALLVAFLLAFPIGIATAVYLEEFAPHNRLTDLIEVNINNLAAVPSIIFGLLGLAVFLNFFELPRSAPLVGGLVLALMTLPTIIIASRASLKGVPLSIREAALSIGASKMQMVMHHVLPLAMPGMLTGAVIGMAQALGESAPLLMIGMVAFVVDIPQAVTDPATALPVQIYLWSDSPERAFAERTAGATLVLLAFLVVMNLIAVILRKTLERRW